MAFVECNDCGKTAEDVVCQKCFEQLKDDFNSSENTVEELQKEIDELKAELKEEREK